MRDRFDVQNAIGRSQSSLECPKREHRRCPNKSDKHVRKIAKCAQLEEVVRIPPAAATHLDALAGAALALAGDDVGGPLDGRGLAGLTKAGVEAVDAGHVGNSLNDVERLLGGVVLDDGVEEGGPAELEGEDGGRTGGRLGRAGAGAGHALSAGRGGHLAAFAVAVFVVSSDVEEAEDRGGEGEGGGPATAGGGGGGGDCRAGCVWTGRGAIRGRRGVEGEGRYVSPGHRNSSSGKKSPNRATRDAVFIS